NVAQGRLSAAQTAVANVQAKVNAAQQKVSVAQGQLNTATQGFNTARANVEQIHQQKEGIRRDIARDVEQFQQVLAQRVSQWQAALQQAQDSLGQIQNRMSNISRFDLPRAQSDLAALENRRPASVASEQSWEAAVTNASNAYEAYKQSVDYDNVETAADSAAANVTQLQGTIASLQSGITDRQALIAKQTTLRDSLVSRLADTNALVAKKQARLADVNTGLVDYDSQHAEIQSRLDPALAALKTATNQYGGLLN
ncbi:MAG: hypothetical protein ACXWSF_20705, partial [Bdellovibrionota bacterium]